MLDNSEDLHGYGLVRAHVMAQVGGSCLYSQADGCYTGGPVDPSKPASYNVNCGYVPGVSTKVPCVGDTSSVINGMRYLYPGCGPNNQSCDAYMDDAGNFLFFDCQTVPGVCGAPGSSGGTSGSDGGTSGGGSSSGGGTPAPGPTCLVCDGGSYRKDGVDADCTNAGNPTCPSGGCPGSPGHVCRGADSLIGQPCCQSSSGGGTSSGSGIPVNTSVTTCTGTFAYDDGSADSFVNQLKSAGIYSPSDSLQTQISKFNSAACSNGGNLTCCGLNPAQVVTMCDGRSLTLQQLANELRTAGYGGPYNSVTAMTAAYKQANISKAGCGTTSGGTGGTTPTPVQQPSSNQTLIAVAAVAAIGTVALIMASAQSKKKIGAVLQQQ